MNVYGGYVGYVADPWINSFADYQLRLIIGLHTICMSVQGSSKWRTDEHMRAHIVTVNKSLRSGCYLLRVCTTWCLQKDFYSLPTRDYEFCLRRSFNRSVLFQFVCRLCTLVYLQLQFEFSLLTCLLLLLRTKDRGHIQVFFQPIPRDGESARSAIVAHAGFCNGGGQQAVQWWIFFLLSFSKNKLATPLKLSVGV